MRTASWKSIFLIMAATMVGPGFPGAGVANADEPTYMVTVKGGTTNQQTGIEPWQRLRAFQTRLRELLQVPEHEDLQVADIGCAGCAYLDPEFDSAKKKWVPKEKAKETVSLEYVVYEKDRARLAPLFRDALVTVKGDPDLDDIGFTVTEKDNTGGPACGGYPSPCNPRAVCTMYNGCSRSAYSCQKCY